MAPGSLFSVSKDVYRCKSGIIGGEWEEVDFFFLVFELKSSGWVGSRFKRDSGGKEMNR